MVTPAAPMSDKQVLSLLQACFHRGIDRHGLQEYGATLRPPEVLDLCNLEFRKSWIAMLRLRTHVGIQSTDHTARTCLTLLLSLPFLLDQARTNHVHAARAQSLSIKIYFFFPTPYPTSVYRLYCSSASSLPPSSAAPSLHSSISLPLPSPSSSISVGTLR